MAMKIIISENMIHAHLSIDDGDFDSRVDREAGVPGSDQLTLGGI